MGDVNLALGLDVDVSMKGFFGSSIDQMIDECKKSVRSPKKLILRVNDCDQRKGTSHIDNDLVAKSAMVDGTIFVSQWMHDYFMERGWACKKNTVIVNGVNGDFFKPKLYESNEVRPVSIVTHHWSDNPLKGQDYVEWLDDFVGRHRERFAYTYIGRTKAQLKNSTYIPPKWGAELGAALSVHDVCVNASRFDPGPNSVIESIACGLPTYVHKDGGGGAEFAGQDHTFSSFDELERILLTGNYQRNQFKLRTWEEFSTDVFGFLKEVYDGNS
jgi:glycosyltransferase involved in cell wall biosynthesis